MIKSMKFVCTAASIACVAVAQQIGSGLPRQLQLSSPPGLASAANRVGTAIRPPAVIQIHEPKYSEEAILTELEGAVVLSVLIGEDGNARDIRIKRSIGLGLDEKAVEAVRGYRFQPAMKDDKPVRTSMTIEVIFRIESNERFWHLVGVAFTPSEGASRPIIVEAEYPYYGPAENAALTVSFEVDQNGTAINFQIRGSSNHNFDDRIIAALKHWRFRPGAKDGTPVTSGCVLDLVWSTGGAQLAGSTSSTLESAAIRGQIGRVLALLRYGADPNVIGEQGYTPLHQAALNGNTAVVRLLLEHGAKVTARSKKGTLPLHDAAVGGNAQTVRALLEAGADIAAQAADTKETALHLAAAWGRIEVVQELVSAGAPTGIRNAKGQTPLQEAAANDQQEAVEVLRKYFR
jgi:TonB family protein